MVIGFTMTICLILLLAAVGLLAIRMAHPEIDVSRGSRNFNNLLTTIVSTLMGFIGGRAMGRLEEIKSNGGKG